VPLQLPRTPFLDPKFGEQHILGAGHPANWFAHVDGIGYRAGKSDTPAGLREKRTNVHLPNNFGGKREKPIREISENPNRGRFA
jgi:hypothetical protein